MYDSGSLDVRWIQGFTNRSIDFVDNNTVCYKCGNYICFLNLETKTQSVFQSPGRGVGALTANGNSGVFAFSDQKLSPSIFVYVYPALHLKNELKGAAQLDYTCLALSDGGPYLACCSSLPDHTITVWNWENAEPICTQLQAGRDLISMVFNPLNWLQLCALGTASLTLWNIERSGSFHVLKSSMIDLPATDGSFVERMTPMSQTSNQPPAAISELMADSTGPNPCNRARLTPTAICWTPTSELYVGCAEGFLLLIDPESLNISVLISPTSADATPEFKGNFQGLTLNKNGLITAGKESLVHCLQIKGTKIDITQTWHLEGPVTTVKYSPDDETLLLSSNMGQIYLLKPTQSDEVVKVLDVLSGDFVTAAFLHSDRNICVSLRHSGELQLWSSDGVCLSFLSLQTEVTALACCPIALYAAVGTASGNILFIDMNKEQQPRLVHQVHLYHAAVDHLVFDQKGHYLLSSSSDSHVYVLDAKPSQMFSVIGYTVIPGSILSLSTQCISDSEEVNVLALCAGQEDKHLDGSVLTVLSLPTRSLRGPDCVDRHGCLSSQVVRVLSYKVPHPLQSCVLGISQVFAYCHERKALQRFQLPGVTDGFSSQQVIQLKPEQEVRAHLLGPASLILSPHHLWLASVGRDGLLQIRETESMEQYMELHCHSCHLGGVRSVSFSTDSHLLLTTGFTDGSLVCTNLRTKDVGAHKVKEATEYIQPEAHFLKKMFDTENPILDGLPAWEQRSLTSTEKPRVLGGPSVDVAAQDESNDTPLCAPPSHPTWLESRREAVIKEDTEQFSETKEMLRETIRQLRDSIQEMVRENDNLPEEHFNLDVDEQKRLEAMAEEEARRVRSEIEWDIVEKCYLHDVLKKEYWDSVKVKGRAIRAFHSELEVQNYPLREQTEKDLEDLSRVQDMRRLENTALTSLKKSDGAQKEEQGKEGHEAERAALTESFSTRLGYSNPYVYDQFSLQSTEQRINQIILLQDTIHRIKMGFNVDFDALHSQKVQELKRIKDRNRQIREIMQDLNMNQELWEPSLTTSEWPESLLRVNDSEIKAERYLTPEQRKEQERKKLEEQSRLAAQVDECRDKGLDDMMDGVLEVKKEDILKDIPPPEFVLTKPEIQWSEEEKKVYKEYEKKRQTLSEEREKYKKSLETEIKKLQDSIKEATERFDEALTKLLETKVRCTVAIYQEELKITYLVGSVLMEEEMRNQELEFKLKLEKMLAYKEEIGEVVRTCEEEAELFHQAYEILVGEDKVLDKEFRKGFFDVPTSMVDHLYKLFKRRPRVQKMRTQTDNNSSLFKEPHLCSSLAPDGLSKMLQAMEELDAPEKMPEGLNPTIWERFCVVRRTKVESEQKVKAKALTLAEMQAFLQRRRDEDNTAQQEIKNLSEALESLHKERNYLLMDTMVQLILKQGQVEVPATDLTSECTDFILYHRSVVDSLRSSIRTLAEQKIASMVSCKDFRKGIIQTQWEHKVMRKQIEDLGEKMRDIKMIQLSEEQHDMAYLTKRDHKSRMSKQVSIMEKSIALMKKTHLKNVQQRMKKIEQINRQAALKTKKSVVLEQRVPDTQVTVAELKHNSDATDSKVIRAAKREARYQQIVRRSNLEELARTQADELAVLWSEVERLTRKNFPSLDQLTHN
ncbi:cilia- and flagella-associated protein 43 [Parambassis ranga]|uniref:Cilia- and flagella-associated protein 43 n=1 Tax=Parambassis ranga TaxID=210632 RepID=A0A6P7JP89_9TELE|nr:cilia- and flagella-associated protein 43 [Parambassis ranga]